MEMPIVSIRCEGRSSPPRHLPDNVSPSSSSPRKIIDPLWPGGIVPYEINEKSFFEAGQTDAASLIRHAITTCINEANVELFVKFTPRDSKCHSDYVIFKYNPITNLSKIGRQGGAQKVCLSKCCSIGSILHEIMHVLGFMHHQRRSPVHERYITIKPDKPNANLKATKRPDGEMEVLLGFLDDDSLMRFSCGNTPSLEAHHHALETGRNNGFSKNDILAIRFLYGPTSCTFDCFGEAYLPQDSMECLTCWGPHSSYRICLHCAEAHHTGHDLVKHDYKLGDIIEVKRNGGWFVCDCGRDEHHLLTCTKTPHVQSRYVCLQCFPDDFSRWPKMTARPGVCLNCAKRCHYGHDVRLYATNEGFSCSCSGTRCLALWNGLSKTGDS